MLPGECPEYSENLVHFRFEYCFIISIFINGAGGGISSPKNLACSFLTKFNLFMNINRNIIIIFGKFIPDDMINMSVSINYIFNI